MRPVDPLRFVPRMLTMGAAFVFLVATVSCDGIAQGDKTRQFSNPVATETLSEGGVNVEQIDEGQYGALVEGTLRVLRDEGAYASFWEALYADRSSVPERPEVDFTSRVVVAVVLGERPSGGYSVEIDEVLGSADGAQVQVRYTESVPGEGCVTTQALTSPYVLATVAVQDADFTFEGVEETRSC